MATLYYSVLGNSLFLPLRCRTENEDSEMGHRQFIPVVANQAESPHCAGVHLRHGLVEGDAVEELRHVPDARDVRPQIRDLRRDPLQRRPSVERCFSAF